MNNQLLFSRRLSMLRYSAYTGCFIMFSVITNIYNKKTTATGKLEKRFLQLEMFDVCTMGDTAYIDTTFMFLSYTRQNGYIDIFHCCNDPCL
jgi:hypothetical protein